MLTKADCQHHGLVEIVTAFRGLVLLVHLQVAVGVITNSVPKGLNWVRGQLDSVSRLPAHLPVGLSTAQIALNETVKKEKGGREWMFLQSYTCT